MAATLEQMIVAAEDNGWEYELEDNAMFAVRDGTNGEPYAVMATFKENPATGNLLWDGGAVENAYDGEVVSATSVYAKVVFDALRKPSEDLDFLRFKQLFASRKVPSIRNDVDIAKAAKVSSRSVTQARITGWMTPELADALAVRIIGMHPVEVWGFDAWCGPVLDSDDEN